MPDIPLLDRIARFIAENDGEAEAVVIARDFLRLTARSGPAVEPLVRAVLGLDARFRERAVGRWSLDESGPDLAPPVVVCAIEIPNSSAREPWLWRVTANLWGGVAKPIRHTGVESTPALLSLVEWLRRYPAASRRAGSLARWIRAQERLHAVPELEPLLIDLAAWRRLLADGSGKPTQAEREESVPADSDYGSFVVARDQAFIDRLVEVAAARRLRSWRSLAAAPNLVRERTLESFWTATREITREQLAELPEEPGVYRFFARAGDLLYVGKAKNLRRRVGSYFRPFERRSGRRACFLDGLHRLTVEPAGTELEALINEARAIREARPPWNVHIELGPEQTEFPLGERDLGLLLPRATGGHTLFLTLGPNAWCGAVDASVPPKAIAAALKGAAAGGAMDGTLIEVGPPERQLVRRFVASASEGAAIFRFTDFATYHEVAEAMVAVLRATADGPNAPLIVRGQESRMRDLNESGRAS